MSFSSSAEFRTVRECVTPRAAGRHELAAIPALDRGINVALGRALIPAILAAVAVGLPACLDDSPSAPSSDDVRLAISAQVAPGPDDRVVAILAYYYRANEDRIDLPVTPEYIVVPRGQSRTQQVTVGIGACLADPQRMPGARSAACRFSIELQLLDADGEFISGQAHEAEVVTPGQTVNVPPFNLPQAALALTSSTVAFDANELEAVPPQSVVGFWSETGAALGAIAVEIEYQDESRPWLSHILAEGSLTLRPTTTDMFRRTYVAIVRLRASREGVAAREIEVRYTVRRSPAGGDFVLFGDGNFIDQTALTRPNNRRLVQRLVDYRNEGPRGGGKQVQVDCGRQSPGGYLCNGGLGAFTEALADTGVQTSIITSTAGGLTTFPEGVKLLVLIMPCEAFSSAEVNALRQFAAEGGRIAIFSEYQAFYGNAWPVCSGAQNQLARELGTGITLAGGQFLCGQHFNLPATSLRSHQITLGMTEVTMGCSSALSIDGSARELIRDTTNENLLAAVGLVGSSSSPPTMLLPGGALDGAVAPRPPLIQWTDLPSSTGGRPDPPPARVPPPERRGNR